MPDNDSNQEPASSPTDASSPPPPPPDPSPWSQRSGKGLFLGLLFAPAVMCLITLAAMLQTNAKGAEALGLVVVPALGICAYCGYWLASGFDMTTSGKILSTIGLTFAFAMLNGIVFFAGCFAVVMIAA